MRLSIRWRLAFWNALAFAVVLLGFAGILYGFLAHALYEQLDGRLLAGFQQIRQDRRLAEDFRERLRYWIHELHEHSNIFSAVYAPDGALLDRTGVLAADGVPEFSPPRPTRRATSPAPSPSWGGNVCWQAGCGRAGRTTPFSSCSPWRKWIAKWGTSARP